MHPAIAQHRAEISAICQRYQIRRLEVFGTTAMTNHHITTLPALRQLYGAARERALKRETPSLNAQAVRFIN